MKIKAEQYNEMKEAIQKIVDFYGPENFCGSNMKQVMWQLFHRVAFDFMNDDTHPNYTMRPRINPHKPGWKMYHDGINDTHWNTVLNKILKELNIKGLKR